MDSHGRPLHFVSLTLTSNLSLTLTTIHFLTTFSRSLADGDDIRLVFGATTCDVSENRGPEYQGIEKLLTVFKTIDSTPLEKVGINRKKRNIFVHPTYVDTFEVASKDENIRLLGLCQSESNQNKDTTHDIALIHLPPGFWLKDEFNFERNNIGTICVEHFQRFSSNINRNNPFFAYGAGFGNKDVGPLDTDTEEETQIAIRNKYQPYLSFLRYGVFGSTQTSKFLDDGDKILVPLEFENALAVLDLDDKFQRDTLQVRP